jgi:hypothetical protein
MDRTTERPAPVGDSGRSLCLRNQSAWNDPSIRLTPLGHRFEVFPYLRFTIVAAELLTAVSGVTGASS